VSISRSRRLGSSLLLLLASAATNACDPARDGYYHGVVEPGPTFSGLPDGWTPTTRAWFHVTNQDWRRDFYDSSTLFDFWSSVRNAARWNSLSGYVSVDATVAIVRGVPDYVFLSCPPGYGGNVSLVDSWLDPRCWTQVVLLHRTCDPDGTQHFEDAPHDTPLPFDRYIAHDDTLDPDPFPALRCGYRRPEPDLGLLAATLLSNKGSFLVGPVASVSWTHDGAAVLVLSGRVGDATTRLYRVPRAGGSARFITSAEMDGPILPLGDGTTVIVSSLTIDRGPVYDGSQTYTTVSARRVALSTEGGLSRIIRSDAAWPQTSAPEILSHDGKTLAFVSDDASSAVLFTDASLSIKNRVAVRAIPVLWRPDDSAVLIRDSQGTFAWLEVDGDVAASALGPGTPQGCFDADGIRCVTADERVVDGITGQEISPAPAPLVEPKLRAGSTVFNTARAQTYAWARRCLGLAETSCTAELRRFSWREQTADVVAHAADALPFAVSPDGHAIAFLDGDKVFIKELP